MRLGRAVVAQRLQRLQPVGRLGVLVDGAADVLVARALLPPVLVEEIEDTHVVPVPRAVYTRSAAGSM